MIVLQRHKEACRLSTGLVERPFDLPPVYKCVPPDGCVYGVGMQQRTTATRTVGGWKSEIFLLTSAAPLARQRPISPERFMSHQHSDNRLRFPHPTFIGHNHKAWMNWYQLGKRDRRNLPQWWCPPFRRRERQWHRPRSGPIPTAPQKSPSTTEAWACSS